MSVFYEVSVTAVVPSVPCNYPYAAFTLLYRLTKLEYHLARTADSQDNVCFVTGTAFACKVRGVASEAFVNKAVLHESCRNGNGVKPPGFIAVVGKVLKLLKSAGTEFFGRIFETHTAKVHVSLVAACHNGRATVFTAARGIIVTGVTIITAVSRLYCIA